MRQWAERQAQSSAAIFPSPSSTTPRPAPADAGVGAESTLPDIPAASPSWSPASRSTTTLLESTTQSPTAVHSSSIVLPPVPPTHNGTGIPRIMHRSWKTIHVPTAMQKWTSTCTRLHPNWTHILWTDAMNRELIKQHYPFFLGTFDAFEMSIMRADAARVFYMHRYGGVYMDLDFECLRALDPLLHAPAAVLAYLSTDYKYEHNIPNAWMASSPNHKFWELAARFMVFNQHSPAVKRTSPETLTGPVMIYNAYHKWMTRYEHTDLDDYKVIVLDSELIYPFDWHTRSPASEQCWARAPEYDPVACKRMLDVVAKASYAITYWSHTWEKLPSER
ncbi:hypothetical protein SeMB42_g03337 [Synchytrium endobioticum]|uniref:Alpha 1,4-glycosyltransferase domain-containing protein n=1 Tax=Synchytrium endobioticum TaxID=286115 RepID=A0A507D7K4_9FUNG|nr:hypothetical protein SeMB42_g03337 [Synchytrium endobioticum]